MKSKVTFFSLLNIPSRKTMLHFELSDFLRACVSETEVQQVERQCEAFKVVKNGTAVESGTVVQQTPRQCEALKVVERKTGQRFNTNCCCWILSMLCSPSNHFQCLQDFLGLNCPENLDLQRGIKIYSNEPDITNNLPMVSFYGVGAPCEQTLLVLCNYASWLKIRLFALAMSWDSFITYGPAICSLYHGRGNSQFLWQLEAGTSRKYADLEQDNVYVWFWMPSRWDDVFKALVCQNLKLHLGKLHYRDFDSASGNKAEQFSKNFFHIVLDTEVDVSFFSSITPDMVWTEALAAKYLTNLRHMTVPGGSPICEVEGITTSIRMEYHNHDADKSVAEQEQVTENIEICEFDKLVLKKEPIEAEELFLDRSNQDSSVCTATKLVDNELNDARELCTRYALRVRHTFCNILPSEPMLVVQCPGCFAQFKGISNRMLRLIKHIETHSPGTRRLLILQVKRRYKLLFDLMAKRLC